MNNINAISVDILKTIIDNAQFAPQGDNCQPWSFVWTGEVLEIHHDSQTAKHPLNPNDMASRIALGALLEYFEVAANHFGFKIQLKNNSSSLSAWAHLVFVKSNFALPQKMHLLKKRFTDRRPYLHRFGSKNAEIDIASRQLLTQLGERNSLPQQETVANLHVFSFDNFKGHSRLIEKLINAIAQAESLAAAHSKLLPSTMKWVRFTKAEILSTRDGIPFKNLGASIFDYPVLRLLQKSPCILKIIKPMVRQELKKTSLRQLKSSAGLICVSVKKSSCGPDSATSVGKLATKTWLELTEAGLSAQPLTLSAILFFYSELGILDPEFAKISEKLKELELLLRSAFKIPEDRIPVWMLRAGVASPVAQSMKTLRRPLEQKLLINSYEEALPSEILSGKV